MNKSYPKAKVVFTHSDAAKVDAWKEKMERFHEDNENHLRAIANRIVKSNFDLTGLYNEHDELWNGINSSLSEQSVFLLSFPITKVMKHQLADLFFIKSAASSTVPHLMYDNTLDRRTPLKIVIETVLEWKENWLSMIEEMDSSGRDGFNDEAEKELYLHSVGIKEEELNINTIAYLDEDVLERGLDLFGLKLEYFNWNYTLKMANHADFDNK